jgi:DNA-binding transcriptional MerR regulator
LATLPPKLYFRIGEVAGLVGVEPHVLRYWEREFRSIRPTKSAKGQRVYSRRDVENLMRVRELLYAEGFTIAGAKKKLQRTGTEPDAAPAESAQEASAPAATMEAAPARAPAQSGVDSATGAWNARAHTALRELRGEIEAMLVELGD